MREGPLSEDKTAEDIERLHASRDDVSAINEHSNAIVAPIRQPLVSIIIPCYNAETWVAEAIESALAQTWPNKEVIVIDDGSTDKSLEVIKRYDGCIRWVAGLNRGACAARNRGIELATGELLKFLDADDSLIADAIELQIKEILHLPDHAIPYGIALDFDKRVPVFNGRGNNLNTSIDNMILSLYRDNIMTSCPLHRAALVRRAGGFDVSLKRGQEWNLHIKMATMGTIFVWHANAVYLYREHDSKTRLSTVARSRAGLDGRIGKYMSANTTLINYYGASIPASLRIEMFRCVYGLAREAAALGMRTKGECLFAKANEFYSISILRGGIKFIIVIQLYRLLSKIIGFYNVEMAIRWIVGLPHFIRCSVRGVQHNE